MFNLQIKKEGQASLERDDEKIMTDYILELTNLFHKPQATFTVICGSINTLKNKDSKTGVFTKIP